MLIDIHTHHKIGDKHLSFIVGKHCFGIHPWDLLIPFNEEETYLQFQQLKNTIQSKSPLLGIGECGLDRRRVGIVSIEDQKKVFLWHMYWALECRLPLIVHCVKAYSDLLELLAHEHYSGKILVHDFSGGPQLVKQLLKFDTYFSFGERLFKEDQKTGVILTQIPRERIFLETDDQIIYSIEIIYQKAATLLGMSLKDCENLFSSNLQRFFSDVDNLSTSDIINNLN